MRFYDAEQLTPAAAKASFYDGASGSVSYAWGSQKPWEITATAAALENDPKRIFAFVKNHIRFEPRFGAQKGAVGAIIDRSGTAFDQAQLLVELLRAAGVTSATYQVGTLTLTGADFTDWVGITDPVAARQFLANGGIPAEVTGSSSISSVTLAHAWVTATVDNVSVTLDPSYKRMDRWTPINVAVESGLSASAFVTAATTTTGSGTESGVPYINGVSLSGAKGWLDAASSQLVGALRGSGHRDKASEEIYGGDRIRLLDDPWANKTTGTLSATWGSHAGGLPDKYRTKLKVVAGLCQATLWADEIYGRRVYYHSRVYREEGPTSHVTVEPGDYDALSVGGKPLPGSSQVGTVSSECAQPPPANSPLFALDLPYAARAAGGAYGSWMDRNIVKAFDQGDVELVIGWGAAGSELQSRLSDDFRVTNQTIVGGGPPRSDGEPLDVADKGAPASAPVGDARLYGAWLAQMTRGAQLIEGVTSSRIQHHYTLGVIYTQIQREVHDKAPNRNGQHDPGEPVIPGSTNDTATRIDIDSGFSTTMLAGGAPEKAATRHLVAAFGAMLEGSMFEQHNDAPETASTARRFPWAQESAINSAVTRYHLLLPGGPTLTEYREGALAGSVGQGAACRAQEMANLGAGTAGYAVVKVNNRYLGPGSLPEFQPGPTGIYPYTTRAGESDQNMQRGCAWIAFNTDASEIAHVITSVDRAFKGSGGQPEQDSSGRTPPSQADLLKDAYKDRSNIGGVDLRSGAFTYSPGPDLSVGQGEFPYALSFQRTYQRGGTTCPKCVSGWTHNLDIRAAISGGGLEAMGETTPLALASPLVGLKGAFELYKANPSGVANHVAAMGVMRWMAERFTYNVVTVNEGAASETFVRVADGVLEAAPASKSKLVQTGERMFYLNRSLFGRAPLWIYGGDFNPNKISFVKTSGTGDKITFEWIESNPSEIVPNGYAAVRNYAQGFYAKTWEFPAGVALDFTYCTEDGLIYGGAGTGSGQVGSQAKPCADRLKRVAIRGTSLWLDIDRLNVGSSDGRSAYATSQSGFTASPTDIYKPVTQTTRVVSGYVDVLGNREEYQWVPPSLGARPSAEPLLVRILSPAPYSGGIVARPDSVTVQAGQSVAIKPMANDDPKFGLTMYEVGPVSNGVYQRSGDTITYTPNAGFHGSDSFVYKVRDESGAWAQATVSITVTTYTPPPPTNNPPVARNDDVTFVRVGPNLAVPYFNPIGNNDSDVEDLNGHLRYVEMPAGPDWQRQADPNDNNLHYTNPAFTYGGPRIYTYSIRDTQGATSGTATIAVTVPDRPPTVNGDVKEWDLSFQDPYVNVLENDLDPDGMGLTIVSISNPSKAVIAGNRLRLLAPVQVGDAFSFTYTVTDGYHSATASVSVSVVNTDGCRVGRICN